MSVSPSGSVALIKRPAAAATVKVVSSVTVFASLGSTGTSFTGVTVMSKVLVSPVVKPISSDKLYVTVGTVPLKLAIGVKI